MTGEEELRKTVWYRRLNHVLEEIRKGNRSEEEVLRLVFCALKNYDAFYSEAMARSAEESLNLIIKEMKEVKSNIGVTV